MLFLSTLRSVNRRTCSLSKHRCRFLCSEMLATFEERVFNPYCKHFATQNTIELNKSINEKNKDFEYEEAIGMLNTLQSNASTIQQSIAANSSSRNLEETLKYLNRSGLNIDDIDKLSVIHVAGTKGKGSTCALTESILRAHNVKTGFFSSPHLVSATERIRINGVPISQQRFARSFWRVFERLKDAQSNDNDMPAYFKFLTILSFHIFLEEKVDVVVLEVGIGGELDCTNIVRNTKTVGITSLGLEHTALLGERLVDIAWQKAGIIKENSKIYTHVKQPECLAVIEERAQAKDACVYVVPDLKEYTTDSKNLSLLSKFNDIIQLNGSLAIQLAYDWLRNNNNEFHPKNGIGSTYMTDKIVEGLTNCHWPGRCQLVNYNNLNVHLDGAHTQESMQVCCDWFRKATKHSTNPKVLIFNRTGNTDSLPLLQILFQQIQFDCVCFTPNFSSTTNANRNDMQTVQWKTQQQVQLTKFHNNNWQLLCSQANTNNNSYIFPSVADSFTFLYKQYETKRELDVLVTGSLHLIGATICALNDFVNIELR